MFYLVGLGLGDVQDITVKGREIVQNADIIFLEDYTSILIGGGKDALEAFYGKKIQLADREMVEQKSDEILAEADCKTVAFLVVGDPFGATTHTDLVLRAVQKGIPYRVVHNASIMNAIGCCGLQLYHYGETVSIVFWEENWKPSSFFDKIVGNKERGLHTLCLLDIKTKEQTVENMMRGNKIYEPPRFMSVAQAASQLLEIVSNKRQEGDKILVVDESTVCVGMARVGSDEQKIVCATLQQMASMDMGPPLHSLILASNLHPLEAEMLLTFVTEEPGSESGVSVRSILEETLH